jgi:uncharacterized protein YdiU (UPF0061 family)
MSNGAANTVIDHCDSSKPSKAYRVSTSSASAISCDDINHVDDYIWAMNSTHQETIHTERTTFDIGRMGSFYAGLPERFRAETLPVSVRKPSLIAFNHALAQEIGLDVGALDNAALAKLFSGNALPSGARPVAIAYAGHQFGNFVPQLGDGRAVLLGEVTGPDGVTRDIQLKGSGRTAFSRGGDGRAGLGPVMREYIVSEAMAALGIPTTRALAAVATGEPVLREDILPGAVFTRVASSHLRVGTFQYFAAREDVEGLRQLADFAIARHYAQAASEPEPYRTFYRAVVARQADLIARWMLVGFIHGVMNTDNSTISGETIDYGPCAFMDAYHPATVFSSIDRGGRYAFSNQPMIAQWNLARLAEAMLPLLADDEEAGVAFAQEALSAFNSRFEATFREGMRAKLGLATDREGDMALAGDLLKVMADNGADFTLTFRRLARDIDGVDDVHGASSLFLDPGAYTAWATRWRERLAEEPMPAAERAAAMDRANPLYIPRNHQVEAAIQAGMKGDFAPFHRLNAILRQPFDEQPDAEIYALPPRPEEQVLKTFCGT